LFIYILNLTLNFQSVPDLVLYFATYINILSFVIFIILLARAQNFQSADWVFTEFRNDTGWSNDSYVFLIGMLLAQWCFTGFDASAHMSEETKNASIAGPRGILYAIGVSFVCGYMLLFAMTFTVQDIDSILNSTVTGQVYINSVGHDWAGVIIFIVIGAMFFCGVASVTANSRMIYAFSRDGGLPGHQFWEHLYPKTKVPVSAVWLATVVAFILGLPSLNSSVAQAAVTSIATIGLYISYGIPILLRLMKGKDFIPGRFHLGKYSVFINIIACGWVALITIMFVLPPQYPVTVNNFNYASVAVGVVILISGGWWVTSARYWFKGPAVLWEKENKAKSTVTVVEEEKVDDT